MRIGAPRIEFHYASRIGDCFDARKSEHDANETGPVSPKASMQWSKLADGSPEMWQAEEAERDHDERGWYRNQKSETAGVFGSEQIKQADSKNGCCCEFFRMRHAEVSKGGKSADGGRYQIIGNKKKRPHDGDNFGAMAHARVNAAAVRIKAADDHVVEADQCGEHAHGSDQPK